MVTFIMTSSGELEGGKAKSDLSVRKRDKKYPQREEEVIKALWQVAWLGR